MVTETTCRSLKKKLEGLSLQLHQQVEGSMVGDDPYNYFVPCENWDEARRRCDLTKKVINGRYKKLINSTQPISYLISTIKKRIEKLNRGIDSGVMQTSFFSDNSVDERITEKSELEEFLRICQNPETFFEEPHRVKF